MSADRFSTGEISGRANSDARERFSEEVFAKQPDAASRASEQDSRLKGFSTMFVPGQVGQGSLSDFNRGLPAPFGDRIGNAPPVRLDGIVVPGSPKSDLRISPGGSLPQLEPGNGSGKHKAEDKPSESTIPEPPKVEPVINKIGREALVIGGGLGEGVFYGMAHLHEKLPQIGASVAIGAALNAISKTGKLGTAAAFVVGGYFTCRYIYNTMNDHERWNKFSNAVTDTWNSDKNIRKNMHDVSTTAGSFAFDTGVSMAAGYVGYTNKTLADLIIQVTKLPIPVPGTAPMPVLSPTLAQTQLLLDIAPPIYTRYGKYKSDGPPRLEPDWTKDTTWLPGPDGQRKATRTKIGSIDINVPPPVLPPEQYRKLHQSIMESELLSPERKRTS